MLALPARAAAITAIMRVTAKPLHVGTRPEALLAVNMTGAVAGSTYRGRLGERGAPSELFFDRADLVRKKLAAAAGRLTVEGTKGIAARHAAFILHVATQLKFSRFAVSRFASEMQASDRLKCWPSGMTGFDGGRRT